MLYTCEMFIDTYTGFEVWNMDSSLGRIHFKNPRAVHMQSFHTAYW